MFDVGRRPIGRLFYWFLAVVMISGYGLMAGGAAPVPQTGPATTTIADTVYLADECMNASAWSKTTPQPASVNPQP